MVWIPLLVYFHELSCVIENVTFYIKIILTVSGCFMHHAECTGRGRECDSSMNYLINLCGYYVKGLFC